MAKDERLRKAFVKLCQHLNVELMSNYWIESEFRHEAHPDEKDCKLVRKYDLDILREEFNQLRHEIDDLSKTCKKSQKKRK